MMMTMSNRQWWPLHWWDMMKQTKISTKNIHLRMQILHWVTVWAGSLSMTSSHLIWSDPIWSDLIQFDSSPKSLSSAQTLPYHTGFPGDSSECKDDNIMKYNLIVDSYLFLESLQSMKFSSQIASRGFTTTQSPSSPASASKFMYENKLGWCLCPPS